VNLGAYAWVGFAFAALGFVAFAWVVIHIAFSVRDTRRVARERREMLQALYERRPKDVISCSDD
jgi:hypothetical protein